MITPESDDVENHPRSPADRKLDPSDVGAPPNAPKPVPVPTEMIAEALLNVDENEILDLIREMQAGKAYRFEDLIQEMKALRSGTDQTKHREFALYQI
jgi:hypothetical protein